MNYSKPHLVIPVPGAGFTNPAVRELMNDKQLMLLGYVDGYNSLAALATLIESSLSETIDMIDRLLVLDVIRILHRSENRSALAPPAAPGLVSSAAPGLVSSAVNPSNLKPQAEPMTLFGFESAENCTMFEPIEDGVIIGTLLPPEQQDEDGPFIQGPDVAPWTYSHVPQGEPQRSLAMLLSSEPAEPTVSTWPELESARGSTPIPDKTRRPPQFHKTDFFDDPSSQSALLLQGDFFDDALSDGSDKATVWSRNQAEQGTPDTPHESWGYGTKEVVKEHCWGRVPSSTQRRGRPLGSDETVTNLASEPPSAEHTLSNPRRTIRTSSSIDAGHEVADTNDWPICPDFMEVSTGPEEQIQQGQAETIVQHVTRLNHSSRGLDALLRRKQQASQQGAGGSDTRRVRHNSLSTNLSPPSPNPHSLAGLSHVDNHTVNIRRKK